ncbi:hypothetical protein GCM10007049_19630 [Echinicola pacifica]|uniref:Uncharacterized protein n=1 Tax=Echinicola pacifica TaxID=346377 RepID=A0A918PXS6_9BACT|nr:hypothetical protein [Echinicola pacifica]GGZ26953.1 hypothetical protein GCM10007049_19630 [Echinicola pacifica]
MKHLLLITFITLVVSSAFCKTPEDKTFLVIFSKKELKSLDTSASFIETSLMEDYKTKSYTGNSDAVIYISIPQCELDKCDIAKRLVQIKDNTWKPLSEIAFRIIDLSESKDNYQELIASYEDLSAKRK